MVRQWRKGCLYSVHIQGCDLALRNKIRKTVAQITDEGIENAWQTWLGYSESLHYILHQERQLLLHSLPYQGRW
jgi:hypothetical protein